MQKYYYNDGANRQGPFTAEELVQKNITPETPVWYEGLENSTTAGEIEEIKTLLVQQQGNMRSEAAPVAASAAEPEKVQEEVTPAAAIAQEKKPEAPAPAPAAKKAAPGKAGKKSTAWLSWVIALLIFGGAGYFVFQNMQQDSKNGSGTGTIASADDSTTLKKYIDQQTPENTNPVADNNANDSLEVPRPMADGDEAVTENNAASAVPPVKNTNAKQPAVTKPPVPTAKDKKAETQAAAQKQASENKAKAEAAQAALLAKEKEYRNNWAKYITIGKLDVKQNEDEGIDPFNVTVFNSTNAVIDKVTVRVDYWKKDKKVVQSETLTIFNIPPGAGLNSRAAGYKKGNNAKAVVTGITCRKLHFCYPGNSYTPDDPFYCN